MLANQLRFAKDVNVPGDRPPVTNSSTASRFGRTRLAVMEFVLCIIVPCLGLLMWVRCDKELQTGLLAGFETNRDLRVNTVYSMISTGTDTVLAVHTQGQIRFWNVPQSKCFGEIQSHLSNVRCAAYSEQQNLLAVGSSLGKLEVWDLNHPDRPLATSGKINPDGVEACEFTPDGSQLCCVGEKGEIVSWDSRTLRRIVGLRNPEMVSDIRCLKFTRDGKYLLAGSRQGKVDVWNTSTRSLIHTFYVGNSTERSAVNVPDSVVESLLVLPGNRECVVVTRSLGISVWDLTTGSCLRRWGEHSPACHSAVLTDAGKQLLTGNALGEIWTWEIATGRRIKLVATHTHCVRALAVNQDGTFVINADGLGDVRCFPYECTVLSNSGADQGS